MDHLNNLNIIELLANNWEVIFIYVFKYLKDFGREFHNINNRLLELEVIEKQRAEHYRRINPAL